MILDILANFSLMLQVALPEGSREISVSIPFSTKEWEEVSNIFLI